MRRIVLALLGLISVEAFAADRLPLAYPHHTDTACILRAVTPQTARDLLVVNVTRDALIAEIAVAEPAAAPLLARKVIEAGASVPIDAIVPIQDNATVVVAGDDRLLVVDSATREVRARSKKIRGTTDLPVDRPGRRAVAFFIMNVGRAPLRIETVAADGSRRVMRDVPAASLLDDRDLFDGFDDTVSEVAVHAIESDAEYFAGFGAVPLGSNCPQPKPQSGKKRAVAPPDTRSCADLEASYQRALADMGNLLKTPVKIPVPPAVDPCCDSTGSKEYADAATGQETALIKNLFETASKTHFAECTPDRAESALTDIAPLLKRLTEKQKALSDFSSDAKRHPALLTAMLSIQRMQQSVGTSSDVEPVADAVAKWVPEDVKYYQGQLRDNHDYKALKAMSSSLKAMQFLTDTPIDLDKYVRDTLKLLRFRMKVRIESIVSVSMVSYTTLTEGEAIVEFQQEDPMAVEVPVPMSVVGLSINTPGGTCTTNVPAFELHTLVTLGDLCSDAPIQINLWGPYGSGTVPYVCTVAGQTGVSYPLPIGLDFAVRASFDALSSSIDFDGKKEHAPSFTNLSQRPVLDVWNGTKGWGGLDLNTVITITLTHEPK